MAEKLVSMKLPKAKAEEYTKPVAANSPRYSYGLQLRLGKDELKKLGLTGKLEAGMRVTITAEGDVTSYEERDTAENGKTCSAEIQITDIKIAEEGKAKRQRKTGNLLDRIGDGGDGDGDEDDGY